MKRDVQCGTICAGLATTFLLLAGCNGEPAAPVSAAPPQVAGTTLRISCPEGTVRKLLDRHAVAWATLQKVKLVFDDQDPDLGVFTPAELGQLVEGGKIAPLPTAKPRADEWNGFTQLYRSKLLLWGATEYAYPLLGDATFVIYRADLFAEANRRPPSTFAEFATHAQSFSNERKRPSLPALPNDDDGLDRLFHSAAATFVVTPVGENDLRQRAGTDQTNTASLFSFHRDVANGQPRLTHPGFAAALDWLKSLQPFRSKSGDLRATLASGDAVMTLGTLEDLAELSPTDQPGRYGVVAIPTGPKNERVPYIGPNGALIAIAKGAKNSVAALALAQYLSSPQIGLETVHEPVFGCAPYRTGQLMDHRDGWYNYGLDVPGTAKLLEAVQAASEPRIVNAPIRYRMPDETEYRRVLLDGVRKCLTENGDSAATMVAIQKRWQELDAAHPMDRRAMYLRSLNLTH